jgi:hypothetical protein
MRAVSVTVSSVAASQPIPMGIHVTPFNVGFGVVVTGTVTYNVEHTFDDIYSPTFNASTANWFQHSTVTAQSTNKDSNYAFPVRAIRLNVTANTAGTATLTLIQAGLVG